MTIDTDTLKGLTTQSINNYSGQFSFFSAGQYQDPILGNLTARGLIKPNLTSEDDTLTSDSKMLMRIILDGSQTYGDSLADQSFDIYEVNELWRGKAVKLQDSIELDEANGPLTSFTIGDEDSIDVELPSEWVDKYRAYRDTTNGDSLYRHEFFGLALVPSNSNKIVAPNMSDTRFVIQNPEADTFDVSTGQWAYMLNRENPDDLQNSVAWHSTHEQVLNLDIGLSEVEIPGSDIAKAELVLYQNNELMEGSLPASEERPEETRAQLYLTDPNQLPESITPGSPIANGLYSSDDEAFHFNITSQLQNALLNGLPEDQEFVVTLVNDGIIKSSVIYNLQASEEKKPKLIITSLTNNSN